jgi:hypothetical protein
MILTIDLKNVQNKSIPLPFAACLVACLQERKTFILSLSHKPSMVVGCTLGKKKEEN